MAATIETRPTAQILPFRAACQGVNRTDRKHRLPAITSAEIENFFDHAQNVNTEFRRAA